MKLALAALLVASLASLGSVAAAEAVKSVTLDNKLVLEISGGNLVAREGKEWAVLVAASVISDATAIASKHIITLSLDVPESVSCQMHLDVTYTYDAIRARIANRSAYLLHVNKDYKGAAAGYAKAVAFDPTWEVAAYNLASALTELKDLDGAIKALAPWLKSHWLATFLQVNLDAELQPLLARPEIVALLAKQRGTATAKITGALYSPELGLVAVPEHTGTFMACSQIETIGIYQIAGDKFLGKLDVRGDADYRCLEHVLPLKAKLVTPQAKLDARDAANAALLDGLGFSPVAFETAPAAGMDDSNKSKSLFAKAKIGIVLKDRTVNFLKGNKSLGSGAAGWKLDESYLLTDANIAVVRTFEQGMEMCGPDPLRYVTVVKLQM